MVDETPDRVAADRQPAVVQQLNSLPLLAGLPAVEVERLAALVEPVTVEPGGYVVRQGELGAALFFIVAGTADVLERDSSGMTRKVAQMEAGDFFGEISLLTAQPRTADVVGATPLSLLRLGRDDYLQLLASRSDLQVQVTGAAAQRAGATLQRLTPDPPQSTTTTPFDKLLHRLVDHEIDTMRAAEVRGDPITFEEVVNFYGATGFLYPAKLGVLESRFDAVRETWERLIAANNDVFKILLLRRVVDGQLVVKNSICAFEYAPGTWQIQHLVSADRHERSGTLASLIGIIDWLYNRTDVKSARWSYRPDNPGTSRLFGGLAALLPADRSLHTLSVYRVTRLPLDRTSQPSNGDGVNVRLAEPDDLDALTRLHQTRHPLMPRWLCLDDPHLDALNECYGSYGLQRARELLVAVKDGNICGSIACWWASEGINFSFLENAIDDLVIDPTLSTDVRASIEKALFASAANRYQSKGRAYAIGLTEVEADPMDRATATRAPGMKTYAELCVEHSCFPVAREYFERRYSRLLYQSSFNPADEKDQGRTR